VKIKQSARHEKFQHILFTIFMEGAERFSSVRGS